MTSMSIWPPHNYKSLNVLEKREAKKIHSDVVMDRNTWNTNERWENKIEIQQKLARIPWESCYFIENTVHVNFHEILIAMGFFWKGSFGKHVGRFWIATFFRTLEWNFDFSFNSNLLIAMLHLNFAHLNALELELIQYENSYQETSTLLKSLNFT